MAGGKLRATGVLAPFGQRGFRFQWPADLATSWAFEMETIILGWYVLTETGSVTWLAVFGSLLLIGTLGLLNCAFGMLAMWRLMRDEPAATTPAGSQANPPDA
jgi:hypothetical protein